MKSRLGRFATVLATFLLFVVLSLWAFSYWRTACMGPRDATWAIGSASCRRVTLVARNGRFEVLASHYTLNLGLFFPETWDRLKPEEQKHLHELFPTQERVDAALQEFKTRTHSEEFHGWDFGLEQ